MALTAQLRLSWRRARRTIDERLATGRHRGITSHAPISVVSNAVNSLSAAVLRHPALADPARNTDVLRRVLAKVAKRAHAATRVRRDGATRSVYGPWLEDRWNDRTFRSCIKGSYGFVFSNYLARRDTPFVLLDIGANVGLYSLVAARNTAAIAIHAFEPDPESARLLENNLLLNSVANVTLHRAAVSTRSGAGTLTTIVGHSGLASLHDLDARVGKRGARHSKHRVRLVGPEYLDEVVNVPARCGVVAKIDTEGHELSVLEALFASRVGSRLDAIWIEFHIRRASPMTVHESLTRHDFAEAVRVGDADRWDALYLRPRIWPL